ncbi:MULTISPECIES: ArsR/SmtB family transcription factor [unclassified Streptomyces]|uniref:ArsR/SmtB family transcription factor n=1 Tax=unclassified Streptomyces TaxID=2593676 RepID=UPI00381B2365
MNDAELRTVLAAVGHPQRLRIVAELAAGRRYVSELARRLVISRPQLYLHLELLERAGIVAGTLELSADGKALRYFELVPFDIHLDVAGVVAFVHVDASVRDRRALTSQAGEPCVRG